jgi:PKD repeat protein
VATPVNVVATPTFDWNFGDGTAHSINQYPTHTYTSTGTYNWSVISTVQSGATQASTTNTGSIVINGGVTLTPTLAGNSMTLNWPNTTPDVLIEESLSLGPNAHWTVVTNVVVTGGGNLSIVIENPTGSKFYRLRKL